MAEDTLPLSPIEAAVRSLAEDGNLTMQGNCVVYLKVWEYASEVEAREMLGHLQLIAASFKKSE